MEHQKIIIEEIEDNRRNQPFRFKTKNWVRFKTSVLRSSLCDS